VSGSPPKRNANLGFALYFFLANCSKSGPFFTTKLDKISMFLSISASRGIAGGSMGKSSTARVRDKDASNVGYGLGKFGPKFPPPCVGKGGRAGLLAVLTSPCG